MGVIQTIDRLMTNPIPEGRVDDILRPEGDNPLLEKGYVTTSVEAKLSFALAEITAAHVSAAFNGGSVATASGITTFTPPKVGEEVRVMLGWDRLDGMERIIWRQCIQTGTVKQAHKRPPAFNSLPVEFVLEAPATGLPLFTHYFDASLAA